MNTLDENKLRKRIDAFLQEMDDCLVLLPPETRLEILQWMQDDFCRILTEAVKQRLEALQTKH